jgi:hypothetical protein
MRKLDSGQCNGRGPERLEASHTGASAFYRAMILLNEVVEILATPHLNVLPPRMLPPQKPKSRVALPVAIERYLARPARRSRRKCFAEERLQQRRSDPDEVENPSSCRAVDSPIEIIPVATNASEPTETIK